MARFQTDTMVRLIDTVLGRSGLTMQRSKPPVPTVVAGDVAKQCVASVRCNLRDAMNVLRRSSSTIRSASTITTAFAADICSMNRFWLLTLLPTNTLAVDLSFAGSHYLVPLAQDQDGRITFEGTAREHLHAEIRRRFLANLRRFSFDNAASCANDVTPEFQRLADRIVWDGPCDCIELCQDDLQVNLSYRGQYTCRIWLNVL